MKTSTEYMPYTCGDVESIFEHLEEQIKEQLSEAMADIKALAKNFRSALETALDDAADDAQATSVDYDVRLEEKDDQIRKLEGRIFELKIEVSGLQDQIDSLKAQLEVIQ